MQLVRPLTFVFAFAGALFTAIGTSAAEDPVPKPTEVAAESPNTRFANFTETMLDGLWEGTLRMRQPLSPASSDKPPNPDDMELRVGLDGAKGRLYLRQKGEWQEVMTGQVFAMRLFSNAVVLGVHGSSAEEDGWIETWSINLSALDDKTVLAEWTRAVTNLHAPQEGDTFLPAFSMAASGQLRRAQ